MKLSVRSELVARRGATRTRSARRPPSAKSPIACNKYRPQACYCGRPLPIGGRRGGIVRFLVETPCLPCSTTPETVRAPRCCSTGERPSMGASGRLALQHGLGVKDDKGV